MVQSPQDRETEYREKKQEEEENKKRAEGEAKDKARKSEEKIKDIKDKMRDRKVEPERPQEMGPEGAPQGAEGAPEAGAPEGGGIPEAGTEGLGEAAPEAAEAAPEAAELGAGATEAAGAGEAAAGAGEAAVGAAGGTAAGAAGGTATGVSGGAAAGAAGGTATGVSGGAAAGAAGGPAAPVTVPVGAALGGAAAAGGAAAGGAAAAKKGADKAKGKGKGKGGGGKLCCLPIAAGGICVSFPTIIIGALFILFIAIMAVIFGGGGGGGVQAKEECTTATLSQDIMDRINNNRPVYEEAARKQNIPWEMVAAVHYREASCDPNKSVMSGETLGQPNPDNGKTYNTLQESADAAAEHLKTMDQSVYGYNLSEVMSTSSADTSNIVYSPVVSKYGIWSCSAQTTNCGFDTSSGLANNIGRCSGNSVSLSEVVSPSAKDYAIQIGVNPADIKIWGSPTNSDEIDNLIRAEVSKQWPSLADKHGTTQAKAQQAILSYAHHEGGLMKFEQAGGSLVPMHDSTTFEPMSITIDKYQGCKNKQYAAAWDTKYPIYLGVQECFGAFRDRAAGEGEQRWKNAIGYVFLPSNPNCYWTGGGYCRSDVSNAEWNHFASETEYKCSGSTEPESGDSKNAKIIKHAFLAYNRGSMYKNHGCTVDQSPYVMNQFDASYQDMHWPDSECEPQSTRGKLNKPNGAYTVYLILKGRICTDSNVPSGEVGQRVVAVAQKELQTMPCVNPVGCEECPSKYGNCPANAWCGCFVSWVYKEAGAPFSGNTSCDGWKCGYSCNAAESLPIHSMDPQPGDVWVRNHCEHVGIIEKIEGDTVYTIEGNTDGFGSGHRCVHENTHSLSQMKSDYIQTINGGKFHRQK